MPLGERTTVNTRPIQLDCVAIGALSRFSRL
jgi:hypothetical protein